MILEEYLGQKFQDHWGKIWFNPWDHTSRTNFDGCLSFFVELLLKVINILTYIFFQLLQSYNLMENFFLMWKYVFVVMVMTLLFCSMYLLECPSFLTCLVLDNVGASGILLVYYELLVRLILRQILFSEMRLRSSGQMTCKKPAFFLLLLCMI